MSIALLMQQLRDAGAPMEAILIAVAAVEAVEARHRDAEEARKADQRERTARCRAKSRDRNVTVTSPQRDPAPKDNNQTPTQSLPADPDGSAAPTPKQRGARKRALPNGWQPGERSERVCAELGRPAEWMRRTAVEMRVWAEGKGEVRADWDATHEGWMRREANRECSRPEPPPGGPRGSPPGQRVSGLTQHAHKRFHDKRRGGFDDRTLDMDAEPARAGGGWSSGDATGRAGPAEGDDGRAEGGGARTVFDFPQRRALG